MIKRIREPMFPFEINIAVSGTRHRIPGIAFLGIIILSALVWFLVFAMERGWNCIDIKFVIFERRERAYKRGLTTLCPHIVDIFKYVWTPIY